MNAIFDTPYGRNTQAGRYEQLSSLRLYYETYGQGMPLVVIHGNGSSIAGMGFQIDFFRQHFWVIAADSRCHGNSENGREKLTYEIMAGDLLELAGRMDINKMHILGWSDGGIIALMMAMQNPGLIDRVVVMGSNVKPPSEAMVRMETGFILQAIEQARQNSDAGKNPQFWKRKIRQLGLLVDQPDIAWSDLSLIKSRCLILSGEKDTVKSAHTRQIAETIPNAALRIFKGNSHYMPVENPGLFNQTVFEFLTETEPI